MADNNKPISTCSSFDDADATATIAQQKHDDDCDDDSSPTFVSNPNLTEEAQEADHQKRDHPTWVRNAREAPPTPPSVPTVAGAAAPPAATTTNNNGAVADDTGFVFVTRPLHSIRLKDPWATSENLPGVKPPPPTHTTLPVTQIRRNLITRTSDDSSPTSTSATTTATSAGAPGSNGLFDVEVFAEGEDGERTVITPGAAFLDLYDPQTNEFILVIEQKSFYHDVLASFSTADEIKSAQEERYRLRGMQEEANTKRENEAAAARRGWFSWRSIPPIVQRGAQQQRLTATAGGGDSTDTDVSGMLTESQTYESMLTAPGGSGKTTAAAEGVVGSNNINSPTGGTPPHDSAPTLSQHQWERVWKQFKCDIGRENFCVGEKRITDPDVALIELQELFETFAVDLRDFAKQQQEKEEVSQRLQKQQKASPSSASIIGSSLWYALAFPVELASWSSRLFVANTATPAAASATAASTLTANFKTSCSEDIQDRTPSEYQREAANAKENAAALAGALSRMVVLLSQQSVLALPYELFVRQFVDSDQLNGAAIYVGETRYDERSNASDESVRGGMRVKVHRAAAYEAFCQARRQAATVDANTPPAPRESSAVDTDRDTTTNVPPQQPLGSRPSIYITIEKEFRVFSIPHDDVDDRTLFHISAQISFCITDGGDVVQLRWLLNPPPPPVVRASPQEAPLSPSSDGAEGTHLPRLCECLGATSGFHRSSCPLKDGVAAATS